MSTTQHVDHEDDDDDEEVDTDDEGDTDTDDEGDTDTDDEEDHDGTDDGDEDNECDEDDVHPPAPRGVRCRSTHPSCAQLARPEPCPFGCELRGRCPLQRCCAFAHGDAERDCPPYIRARPSSREACDGSRTARRLAPW